MSKTILLAERPDIVLKLEKYDLLPEGSQEGVYTGCAKQWAKEGTPPYDNPEYKALAERLPTGWEELTREELNELLGKLRKTIAGRKKAKLDIPNRGSEKMVRSMTQIAFLGTAAAASLLAEKGIGLLPDEDEKERDSAKEYSVELVFHLINGTGFLERVFQTIAETISTRKENQELIGTILNMTAGFLAMMAAANGKEDKLKKLMASFKTHFDKGMTLTESFVSEKLAEGTIKGDQAERTALYLQQARIAMDKEDFDGFYEAFTEALETMQVIPERFSDDMKKVRSFAKELYRLIETGLHDETSRMTAISQAM